MFTPYCTDCGEIMFARLDFGVVTVQCQVDEDGDIHWDLNELSGCEPEFSGWYCPNCDEQYDAEMRRRNAQELAELLEEENA